MSGFALDFNSPWYLLLLGVLPLVWLLSFRSLAGLGPVRRLAAIALRSLVLLLLIASLAEIQLQRTHERLTVIYLLDQSESIPKPQREAMVRYAVEDVAKHRDRDREDRAGLIVFGRDAAIEVPPYDDDLPIAGKLETLFDMQTDATNLAAAMKLAQATFSEDSAKRIVVVSDGNENLGDARAVARSLAEDGIGIDVVPITLSRRGEVAVEKVALPDVVRQGQPIEARIVLTNMTQPSPGDPGHVRGTLRLVRRSGDRAETVGAPLEVDLPPGKSVFTVPETILQPDFYTYEARFDPADPERDRMAQNNRASAFTHVRGRGRVLLIEDFEHQGEFADLIERLKDAQIEVTRRTSDQAFSSLAELQRYDSVILANVPRTSTAQSGGTSRVTHFFSDEQIRMLVRNTQQMGAGLVMIGGDRSFGAGDWAGTELEKAMPVDFTIKNKKVRGVGALVLVMHASEMAQGNHWQKVVAKEAIKNLGPMDYCGLLHWNDFRGSDDWLWKDGQGNGLVLVGNQRNGMLARVDRMTPGDMPQFDPAMKKALAAFNGCTAATTKHMIIISDGDPSGPSWGLLQRFKNAKPKGIQVTTVAIGTHGPPSATPLQRIASTTGGKFYAVTDPRALPRIYQREVRRIARPLVYEQAVRPRVTLRHDMLRGIDEDLLPVIGGFVLTSKKENPLVEVSVVSPKPAGEKNATILASWTFGLGRTVVLTTDAGQRWAAAWRGWDKYDRLFEQIVRWSMRPTQEEGKFTVATDVVEGKVRVVVTALGKDDRFLNFLTMSGSAVTPDMKSVDVPIRQTAPGRYVGQFDAAKAGSYFITITGKMPKTEDDAGDGGTAEKMSPFQIRTGVGVPYSDEFRFRETNRALLTTLARFKPSGGKAGEVIEGPMVAGRLDPLLATDTFRHTLAKAVSSRDVWPGLMLAAACIFFADVLVRRVTIGLEWLWPLLARARDTILRREPAPVVDERIERLRSRKREISLSIDQRRAAARFEPEPDADVADAVLEEEPPAAVPPERPAQNEVSPEEEEDSYTERLLKAKKRVWKDKRE